MLNSNQDVFRVTPRRLIELPLNLQNQINKAYASGVLSDTQPVQIWAHRPELASKWLDLLSAFHTNSLINERTRELMRLKIASVTNCDLCQLARKTDLVTEADITCIQNDDTRFAEAEMAALTYADLFASDYKSIDKKVFESLRQHYSEAEIVEINMYCALMLAGGRMTYVHRGL